VGRGSRPAARLDGYALVTGATAGLGAEFARQLAAEGRPLVLVARDEMRLHGSAKELAARYGVEVEVLSADLSTVEGCDRVAERLASSDKPVDTLVNNAGFGLGKRFGGAPLEDEIRMLDVLVTAVLRLSYAAAEQMRERGRGEILNVSSVAGFIPNARSVTYSAAKAWVTSFSESLSLRLAPAGVQVCAVCPGFTHTEFHERANLSKDVAPSFMWLDASRVVADGLRDMRAGKPVSVPSKRYAVLAGAARSLPRPLVRKVLARR
jgi:short-subunit dehydrogenase